MKIKKILTLIAVLIIVLTIIFFWMKGDQGVTKNDIDSYEETQPVAVLGSLESRQPYYLNKHGRVITETIEDIQNSDIITIFYNSTNADINDQFHIDFFQRLLMFVRSDILFQNDIYIESIKLSHIDNVFEAQLTTIEGWQILINSEADFEKQLNNLLLTLQEEIEDRAELENIDLRYEERIFYKLKSS